MLNFDILIHNQLKQIGDLGNLCILFLTLKIVSMPFSLLSLEAATGDVL